MKEQMVVCSQTIDIVTMHNIWKYFWLTLFYQLQRGCVIDQELNCVKMFCGIMLILLNIARNWRIKPLQPCFG